MKNPWSYLTICLLMMLFNNCIMENDVSTVCGLCMGKYTNHTLVDLANEMHLCLEARMYAESLPGVLIDLKQSSYVYIFYGDQASHLVDSVIAKVSALGFRLSVTSLHENEALFSCCTLVMPEFDSLFILVSSLAEAIPVLSEARMRNLIGPLYSWLVFPYNYSPVQLHQNDVITDGDRVSFLSLNMVTFHGTNSAYQNCERTVTNAEVELDSFYNSTVSSIGAWDLLGNWTFSRAPLIAFSGFNGKVFKIATLPVDYISFRFEFNGTVVYKGFFIELMEEMAKLLDFRIQIVEPPSGTWAEIIFMVVSRQVDLAIGPFTITADRKEYVDFMYPVLTEQLSFIMYVPSENPLASSTLVFEAFTYPVWIIFYLTAILCATILWILVIMAVMPPSPEVAKVVNRIKTSRHRQCWNDKDSYSDRYKNSKEEVTETAKSRKLSTWFQSFFYIFAAAYVQGGTLLRNTLSIRIFDIFIRAAILVTVAAYTGNLTAFLTVQKTEVPVNTLEELVNQDVYKVGILGNSAHQDIFEHATTGILQEVWKKIQEDPQNNLQPDIGSGLEKVSDPKSKFIYITEKTLSDIALRVDCNLGLAKEVFFPRSIAFPIQKGSPYTPLFNEIIMNMHEGGLIWKWRSRYLPENQCDSESTQTTATSLPLIALLGAFEIVLLGNLIAAAVFGIEKAVFKYKRNKVTPLVIKVQSKAS